MKYLIKRTFTATEKNKLFFGGPYNEHIVYRGNKGAALVLDGFHQGGDVFKFAQEQGFKTMAQANKALDKYLWFSASEMQVPANWSITDEIVNYI